MIFTPQKTTVPIERREDGLMCVRGTRITLGMIIQGFNGGLTPEEIFMAVRVISLADIYEIIAFYLRNLSEVDAYIREERAIIVLEEADLPHAPGSPQWLEREQPRKHDIE